MYGQRCGHRRALGNGFIGPGTHFPQQPIPSGGGLLWFPTLRADELARPDSAGSHRTDTAVRPPARHRSRHRLTPAVGWLATHGSVRRGAEAPRLAGSAALLGGPQPSLWGSACPLSSTSTCADFADQVDHGIPIPRRSPLGCSRPTRQCGCLCALVHCERTLSFTGWTPLGQRRTVEPWGLVGRLPSDREAGADREARWQMGAAGTGVWTRRPSTVMCV